MDYLSFQPDFESPDAVAAYDELPLWSAMFGLLLLRHVPLRRGISVLDVGCGTGFPLLELAQRLGPTCRVHGLDPWEPALERARFKARVWNVRNVEIHQGTAEAMPFPDATFELLVSNLGVNNFDRPEAALAECRRVAKPDARLVLTTNLRGHMEELYQVYAETLRQLGREADLPTLERHVDHRASVESVTTLLETHGFRVVHVHRETETMRFLDGSALLRHYFIQLGFLGGWKGVVAPSDQAEVFKALEENLNRRAEARGGLGLTIPMVCVEAERG
ncbi:MAG TPA: methyltransferase domain-containing protein [Thermoanaerobaculia bacterium]|nr:methyltransferase domain-containing protein [Thermoanaerobaculia bacterium]